LACSAVARAVKAGDAAAERTARTELAMAKVKVVLEMVDRLGLTFTAEQVQEWAELVGNDGRVHMTVPGGKVEGVVGERGAVVRGRMSGTARYEF
jgi:hypothetical protein